MCSSTEECRRRLSVTAETRSPTSDSGSWNTPTNAYSDDPNYAFCGNGEGGRIHDYDGYGFAAEGNINEVRVDVKGYSGNEGKHSVNVYVWDGTDWRLVGTITSEMPCDLHQFDASAYIDSAAKLNNIKTRIESVGLDGGGPTTRFVRVCWIPVYADWTPPAEPVETVVAKDFPMMYLSKPPPAKLLMSKVTGGEFTETSKTFPYIYSIKGHATQLQSKWVGG